jgi:hypothetical protein
MINGNDLIAIRFEPFLSCAVDFSSAIFERELSSLSR